MTKNGRSPDYRFLSTTGQGRFVGLALHVYQTTDLNPNGPWWGEGDEKIFVDGESMPSWFGTGSEDYFGFAWGTPGYFSRPYHSQLLAPPGNLYAPGNRALTRFHIADNVPFQSAFDGCIERWKSLPPIDGSVQLEIIVDRDTIEIYGNNGELYMPMPANNSSGNSLI